MDNNFTTHEVLDTYYMSDEQKEAFRQTWERNNLKKSLRNYLIGAAVGIAGAFIAVALGKNGAPALIVNLVELLLFGGGVIFAAVNFFKMFFSFEQYKPDIKAIDKETFKQKWKTNKQYRAKIKLFIGLALIILSFVTLFILAAIGAPDGVINLVFILQILAGAIIAIEAIDKETFKQKWKTNKQYRVKIKLFIGLAIIILSFVTLFILAAIGVPDVVTGVIFILQILAGAIITIVNFIKILVQLIKKLMMKISNNREQKELNQEEK